MRKIKLLTALTLTIIAFAFGCKEKSPKELIANKWTIKDLKWADANKMPDSLTNEIVGKTSIEFTPDNKYTYAGAEAVIQSGTYSLSEDGQFFTLTSDATGQPEKSMIKELTSDRLVFVDQGGNEFTTSN